MAADWAAAAVAQAAVVSRVAMAAADQGAALVAEEAVVSEAAVAAANQAGATDLVVAMALATASQAVVTELEEVLVGVVMAGWGAARDLKQTQNEPLAAPAALRFLQRQVQELKARLLHSFPLLKSSGDASDSSATNLMRAHGLFSEHQHLPLPHGALLSGNCRS